MQMVMFTSKFFALWRIFECSSQWVIDFLFITCYSRKFNKLCWRKTTKQKELTLWALFCLLSFYLVSCSWVRKSRDSSLSCFVRTTLQVAYGKARTVIVSERFCSNPVVELAIAEMACVSRNVRRTFHVPSGVPVQRSISERDVSYPSCFANPPPQRLSSLFSRVHRRFVEGCLLKHQQVM